MYKNQQTKQLVGSDPGTSDSGIIIYIDYKGDRGQIPHLATLSTSIKGNDGDEDTYWGPTTICQALGLTLYMAQILFM